MWRIGAIQGLAGIASYAIGLWLPQIVRAAIGQSDLVVGIVSAVPPLVAVAAIFFVSGYVDRTGERLRVITTGSLVSALGLATSAFLLRSPVPIVLALAIGVAAMYATYAPTLALPSFFLTGTASAAAIALVTALGNVGGFVGPYLVGVLKDTTGDYKIGLLALAIVTAMRAPIALSLHQARVLVRA